MIITNEKIKAEGYFVDEQGLVYSHDRKRLIGATANFSTKEVVIEEGTRFIGTSAFQDNTVVESVTLPDTVEEIGDKAFGGCEDLRHLKLSQNLTKLNFSAFSGLEHYIQLELPKKVYDRFEIVASNALSHGNIVPAKNITLTNDKGEIPKEMGKSFENNDLIEALRLEDFLIEFDDDDSGVSFRGCTNLKEVVITGNKINPDYFHYDICAGMFKGCVNLEKVILFGNCKLIYFSAFAGCENLKYINIPALTDLNEAFDGKLAYMNDFVDLSLSSGTLWARYGEENREYHLGVLADKELYQAWNCEKPINPSRAQMQELFASCAWSEANFNTTKGWIGVSQYNGNEIFLPDEDYQKIHETYSIQYKYEYASITGPDAVHQIKLLNEYGEKGFDAIVVNPTVIILRREIKL